MNPTRRHNRFSRGTPLQTAFPEVAADWHPTRNGPLRPVDVSYGNSTLPIVWQCPVNPNHVWEATANSRTTGSGCPYCRRLRVAPEDSLGALYPEVAAEWAEDLNDVSPYQVAPMSSKKVMWRCRVNPDHVWRAAISNRTSRASGCPHCSIAPESRQAVLLKFEVLSFLPFDPHQSKVRIDQGLLDVDVLVPTHRLVIEFDGSYWHEGHEVHDAWKAAALRAHGWRVVRIREEPLAALDPHDLVVPAGLSVKELAGRVLEHLATVLQSEIPGLTEYLQDGELRNARAAESYMDEMLRGTLDGDGPRWRTKHIRDWNDGYRRLVEYSEECGSPSPPADYKCDDGFPLGEWVKQQRARHPDLSPERRDLLGAIDFVWSPRSNAWEVAYRRLEQYVRSHGAAPPQSYVSPDGFRLGVWLNGQRQSWDTITEDRRLLLNTLGVTSAPRDVWRQSTWETGIAHLARYVEGHGHASPPQKYVDPDDGYRLGAWVCGVRQRASLTPEQESQLLALGLVWNMLEHDWGTSLEALVAHYSAHAPNLPPLNSTLGRWLERQRQAFRSGEMRNDRLIAFELRGVLGLLVPHSWEEGISRLTSYLETSSVGVSGSTVDPNDGFPLGKWLLSQMRRARRGALDADHMEAFISLGVVQHRESPTTDWDDTVRRIALYISANGRTPPKRYVEPDGFPLGTRVQYIRQRAREGLLPEQVAATLAEMGFDFAPPIGRPRGVQEYGPRHL